MLGHPTPPCCALTDCRAPNKYNRIIGTANRHDLEHATVYVSVLADDAEQQKVSLAALNNAAPFLRKQVMARVHIRRVPSFEFEADHTIEEGARMLDLMKKVAAEREPPTDR